MSKKYWLKWIKAAGIRAVKTMAQTAIATIGTAALLDAVSWQSVASASVLAGVLSLLTSLAGIPEVEKPDGNTNVLEALADELNELDRTDK